MKATIYRTTRIEATLTTENPASSYGIPVLEIEGKAYGPADLMPSGLAAGELARRYLAGGSSGAGNWIESAEGRAMAEKFLLTEEGLRQ